MATRMMTKGMTFADHAVSWVMVAGLALALIQYAQTMALPAHFV